MTAVTRSKRKHCLARDDISQKASRVAKDSNQKTDLVTRCLGNKPFGQYLSVCTYTVVCKQSKIN